MATNNSTQLSGLAGNHKFRLAIILLLLVICAIWYFKDANLSNMNTISGIKEEIGKNAAPDTTDKKVLMGVGTALLGAAGYEGYQIWRDHAGNEVASGTPNAKATNDYNCADFKTQPEAQAFFIKAGGPSNDTNRLDGDKNGVACQALPKK